MRKVFACQQPILSTCASIDLGGQTGGSWCAWSVGGGKNMVVKQVGGQDREIEHELGWVEWLACKIEN